MNTKNTIILSILSFYLLFPVLIFAAQTGVLPYIDESFCSDFNQNLYFGMTDDKTFKSNPEIKKLQYALIKEGFSIPQTQFGIFGIETFRAVVAFQEKYKNEVIISANFKKADGKAGPVTRKKLTSLYGCTNKAISSQNKSSATILTVKGILLNEKGISITFCNLSLEEIPVFPVRIRLNGIVREFDIKLAHDANTCYPALWSYDTWGLEYNPNIIYSAVVSIDPFGYYKKGSLTYPDLENITIPAVEGIHLGVRSLMFKNDSLQATFCNSGTEDIIKFPVNITLNGTTKDFDINQLYKSGKCYSSIWKFDTWGINYIPGTIYTAVVIVGKDFGNDGTESKNLNEFSNAAIISGSL